MSIAVNEMRCPQNHQCPAAAVCPFGALEQDGRADAWGPKKVVRLFGVEMKGR